MSDWDSTYFHGRARKYPIPTQQVDVSADLSSGGDADYSDNPLRRIICYGSSGSIWVQMIEDSVIGPERPMSHGAEVTGVIIRVSHNTTATYLVGER